MDGRGPILRSVGRWGGGISHTGRALQDAADGLGHVDAGGGEGEGGVRRAAGAAVHRRQGGGTSPYRAGGGGGVALRGGNQAAPFRLPSVAGHPRGVAMGHTCDIQEGNFHRAGG